MLAQHKTLNPHRVFLKMNAGMNRLGLAPHAFGAAWSRLQALPQVGEISLMAHFSDADVDDGTYVQHQVFEQAAADLPGERSLSNSAALLRVGACRADWVRPGLMLYGASPDHPSHTATDWGLQPAMTLSTCIVAVQKLQAGDSVGYGSSFTAQGPMRIGVVACGYADGYMRQTPAQGAPVLVDGIKTRTLGRISMDLITLDLNPVPQARVGSTVTLWGNSPQGTVLPIEEVAQAGGTLAYELMCGVAPRVRKLASSGHGFAQTQHNNGTHHQ
jgi:alanine racemase